MYLYCCMFSVLRNHSKYCRNIIYYLVVSYIHPLPLKLFAHSADGWPAHEGRQHIYSRKLLCLQGVVEGCLVAGCRKMVGSRVPHGYTAGQVFPHRTCTCQNRYLWQVTPVTTHYFRGTIQNPWYLWYPRYLFIKTLYIH